MARKSLFIFCLVFLFSVSLWPYVEGKIEGVVTDREGNPLEKVEVTITSSKMSSRKFQVSTNKNGKFTQIGIWPGYYQVRFIKSGFAPQSHEVRVSISESTRLDIKLEAVQEAAERLLSAADQLFLKASNFYEKTQYEEAVSAYKEAIALNAAQWGYFFNLGLALKKMENRDASIEAFREALKLNPNSYSCFSELGEALAKKEDYEEAKTFYLKATELSPDDPDAFYNLGVVLTNLGNSEEALKYFLRAVDVQADYVDALYQIGTIYIGKGQTEDAVKNLEKFLELAPEHPNAAIAKQLLEYLKKQGECNT
ncbi:MAG: tetratricopeptide repeat protein [Candidatus Aminicenantes bacterium]|nr:tetratricopeptide repeat protein [Candidatus Aminicenantes bacterium]